MTTKIKTGKICVQCGATETLQWYSGPLWFDDHNKAHPIKFKKLRKD